MSAKQAGPAIEIKPTTFANGVPKQEHNGFYGIEQKLLDMPIGTQIVAVVTYRLKDDITKRGDGTRYPVMGVDHIEPIWDADQVTDAEKIQEDAYTERTGQDQLDFTGVAEKVEGEE